MRARIEDVPSFLTVSLDEVRAWESAVAQEAEHKQERRSRADEKLLGALGVVVAAVISAVTGLAMLLPDGAVEQFGGPRVSLAVVSVAYVAIQMINVFLAAVEGFCARPYLVQLGEAPMPGEDARLRLLRQCRARHKANVENTELNNHKLSQWMLCVMAIRNAGVGMLVEVGVVNFILIYRAV